MADDTTQEKAAAARASAPAAILRLVVRIVLALILAIFAVALLSAGGTALTLAGVVLGLAALAFFVWAIGSAPAGEAPAAANAEAAANATGGGGSAEQEASDAAARFEAAVEAHREELAHVPTPERRKEMLAYWRGELKVRAHDYLDLVDHRPEVGDQVAQFHVQALMQAYLAGYLAGRGWAERGEAEQLAYVVGRALRDRLRGLGLNLESVNLGIGAVIDELLCKVVAMGVKDGGDGR